jgi:hypothetical protein
MELPMAIATSSDMLSRERHVRMGARILVLLPLLLLLPSLLHAGASDDRSRQAAARCDSLPVVFRDADDPLDPRLLYRGDGAYGRVGFTRDGVRYGFRRNGAELVVALTFEGSREDRQVTATEGMGERGGIYSFKGTGSHSTIIRQYSEISYRSVYDGIDIHYYNASGSLKYDCLVRPLADPARIRMRYDGADRLAIAHDGDLRIITPWGELRERHPHVYQIVDGVEKTIDARFRLMGEKSFGFEIGAYDRRLPLVIDPMVLGWSTFVGGSGTRNVLGDGYVHDMTVDAAGDVYCVGWYNQTFPTTPGVYQESYRGDTRDGFVFKLSGDGRQLLFCTYIGGSLQESCHGVALGSDGSIYVGGHTESDDFPLTAGAYNGGTKGAYDCFILKLSSDGKSLLYSSRFGGGGSDTITHIRVDPSGAVTATGVARGAGYPTSANAYDRTFSANGNASDLFITRLSPDGRSLLFSTYVGGAFSDFGADLAVDGNGETVVTGETYSTDFPTTAGAYDRTPDNNYEAEAFLLRLSADGSRLVYSTFFGGSDNDGANAVALGAGGRVVIAGYTESNDLPVSAGAFDRLYSSRRDGFVAILAENGSRLVAASYAGSGGNDDELQDVELDDDGTIFIAGKTLSTDAITPLCPIPGIGDGHGAGVPNVDIYIGRMKGDLSAMLFADYIGGDRNDYGTRIALHPDRCRRELVVSITSHSSDFPTTQGAYQRTKLNDDEDQPTVMKIRPTITPEFRSSVSCSIGSFTDMTRGSCIWGDPAWRPTTWLWDFGDGTTSTEQNPKHRYTKPGTYRVVLKVGCPRDSIASMIQVDDSHPMLAHIGRGHLAAPGDTIGIPMMLDSVGDAGPITSLRISLRYDTLSMRLVNITPFASDSLFYGSIIANWRMTVDTLRNGIFSAIFVAPPGQPGLVMGGELLYLRFRTYIRPNAVPASPWSDTNMIPFDISTGGSVCGIGATDPGLLRLELCGLATRLIVMGSAKYSLSVGPPNPFSGPLVASFTLGLDGPTTVTLFDATGTRVATLLDGHLDEGNYTVSWNGNDLPSGIYYIRIVSGDWTATRSLIKVE